MIQTRDNIVFEETEKRIKYVGIFEIFSFLTVFVFLLTFIFATMTTYNRDIVNNSIIPTNKVEKQYLENCKKDYAIYKSMTYKTLNVFFTMFSIIFFLMFFSAFLNVFIAKEKRRFLIIGIDLLRIFDKEKKVLLSSITLGHPTVIHARSWFWLWINS